MKTLVVGGAGVAGSATSLLLQDAGHDVTIMSRSKPGPGSRLDEIPFVAGNYVEEDFSDGAKLEGYDWMVFCAGSDMGNYTEGDNGTQDAFFEKANTIGLPRFFEAAKKAGIKRTAYMGSWYSFQAPQMIETIAYVRSRHLSDQAIRALSTRGFNVCSCALPWIVGFTPGLVAQQWLTLARLAQGKLEGVPDVAPGWRRELHVKQVGRTMHARRSRARRIGQGVHDRRCEHEPEGAVRALVSGSRPPA
jgi:dihydroflavonol-4-reductase